MLLLKHASSSSVTSQIARIRLYRNLMALSSVSPVWRSTVMHATFTATLRWCAATEMKMPFLETSARTADNVEKAFVKVRVPIARFYLSMVT